MNSELGVLNISEIYSGLLPFFPETETREAIEERLHGVEEEGDAHTHTHTVSEGQWG